MIWEWDDGVDITKSYGFYANQTATTGEGPWSSGEPNEYREREEDCVQIRGSIDGKYNDAQCEVRTSHPLCNKGKCLHT